MGRSIQEARRLFSKAPKEEPTNSPILSKSKRTEIRQLSNEAIREKLETFSIAENYWSESYSNQLEFMKNQVRKIQKVIDLLNFNTKTSVIEAQFLLGVRRTETPNDSTDQALRDACKLPAGYDLRQIGLRPLSERIEEAMP